MQIELTRGEQLLGETRVALSKAQADAEGKGRRIDELLVTVATRDDTIRTLEAKVRDDEALRRKLHNAIQELKGNIRVYCRVRPPLPHEATSTLTFQFASNDERAMEIQAPAERNSLGRDADKNGRKWNFQFDKVFRTDSTQAAVFDEVSQLVQSALDGYHTCIFTYGQTGSGKTFTMEGPEEPTEEMRGVIPRAVEQIFASAKRLEAQGWSFEMDADMLEIYNESIRDLLGAGDERVAHDISHDRLGNTSVSNLNVVRVSRPSQVHELLRRAARNRAVGATKCNERSSRSHSVFQLRIVGRNGITGEEVRGLLNLIDLAGSERLDQSQSTGDRLTETKNINKSLSNLGQVIQALANRASHVPYRNSKLTYLLQDSLGGNSKTLMFVNVSPLEKDLNESLNSLRFATVVNACDIGTAKKTAKIDLKL